MRWRGGRRKSKRSRNEVVIYMNIKSEKEFYGEKLKRVALKCINAVLEPQGAPCDCNLVLVTSF